MKIPIILGYPPEIPLPRESYKPAEYNKSAPNKKNQGKGSIKSQKYGSTKKLPQKKGKI
ncbi:hypothetical protein AGMMS50249_4770 [candidate division SR1 bacterium]|nr:hypothetical protein AGMMS50249_4770 [candidate division SR1 bacterium]